MSEYEARVGRDRSNANLIPGRKSLSGETGKHSPVINVRVTEHTRDGLREVADEGESTITKVARTALDEAHAYFVIWEQSFDGANYQWVRFNTPMTLEQAQQSFEQFTTTARALQFRRMQIRRGRDLVIREASPPW